MRRDLRASSNWAVKGTCVHACLCGMICLSKLDAQVIHAVSAQPPGLLLFLEEA